MSIRGCIDISSRESGKLIYIYPTLTIYLLIFPHIDVMAITLQGKSQLLSSELPEVQKMGSGVFQSQVDLCSNKPKKEEAMDGSNGAKINLVLKQSHSNKSV